MRITGGIKLDGLHFAIFAILVFVLGIPGNVRASTRYKLATSPSSLSFSWQIGNAVPAPQAIKVMDNSANCEAVTITTNKSWLTASPASGCTAPLMLSVSINTTGLAAGNYSGNVTISGPTEASTLSVPVTLAVSNGTAVTPSYDLVTSPSSLSFSWQIGNASPAPQAIKVMDNSANCEPITITTKQSWLTASPASGCTAPLILSVSINTVGLAAGSYSGNVTISGPTEINSPFQVPVTLVVSGGTTVAPAITTQPASQTITSGKTATFSVAATGTSPMTYQWRNGAGPISGATSSTYTTPAETSNATFTVAVVNSAGSATSNSAVLTVSTATVAPAITTQPASQTITSGKTATFSVAATGTSPMTYQWSNGSGPISGATSSTYTTPGETSNATFTVTVSNSAGSATSNPATLTVSASTLLLNSSSTSLSFGNVTVSTSGTKTVTLTNGGNSNVTISNVSVSGPGFTASGVSAGLILSPGQTAALTATFDPASAGSVTGSIVVASNATNSPDNIALSGTGMAVVNHSAALSWVPSTSTVIGYNTYSSTTSSGPYTKLTATPVASASYMDSTVQAGQTYYYVVTAVDSNNVESIFSSQVTATIP